MENFLGEIRLFAGTFAPQGWALCNGQLLSISQYDALYTLLGTTYGGDGQTTFGLPDLQGRIPIGQGTGTGLTPRTIGQVGGEENHTLTSAEIASHNHPANVTSANATGTTASSSVIYGTVIPDNADGIYGLYVPTATTAVPLRNNAIANAGGSLPHDNTMPTLTINFIIALQGIYPTQS